MAARVNPPKERSSWQSPPEQFVKTYPFERVFTLTDFLDSTQSNFTGEVQRAVSD